MDKDQTITRKLVVFAVAVILLAGLPHFFYDRSSLNASPRPLNYPQGSLLPSTIGNFHAVNRWKNDLSNRAIEEGARYEDPTGTETAQFDIMINMQHHNGAVCYISQGMLVQSRRTEEVQSTDSAAIFDIAFFADQSIISGPQTVLLMASTECGSKGCRPSPIPFKSPAFRIIWSPNSPKSSEITQVPLSITFQTSRSDGGTIDEAHAIQQFRQLIANFRLAPIQHLYTTN
jgi:hypothetical protein